MRASALALRQVRVRPHLQLWAGVLGLGSEASSRGALARDAAPGLPAGLPGFVPALRLVWVAVPAPSAPYAGRGCLADVRVPGLRNLFVGGACAPGSCVPYQ